MRTQLIHWLEMSRPGYIGFSILFIWHFLLYLHNLLGRTHLCALIPFKITHTFGYLCHAWFSLTKPLNFGWDRQRSSIFWKFYVHAIGGPVTGFIDTVNCQGIGENGINGNSYVILDDNCKACLSSRGARVSCSHVSSSLSQNKLAEMQLL